MLKKEYRLIGVAIIIGALAVGAYFYMENDDSMDLASTPLPAQSAPVDSPTETAAPAVDSATPETAPAVAEVPIEAPAVPEQVIVDPLVKQQEELIAGFKNKILLNINLPGDMMFDELDLDGDYAAMQGNSPDKKMVIIAATKTTNPQGIAAFLQEEKSRIPLLVNHDFKISGEIKTLAGPKSSGISKITVIPGGTNNGSVIYAAHLERADKKGSYVFVMEGSPTYFENYDGDWDGMLASLSVK